MKTLLILLAALAVILIVIAKVHPIGKKISLYIVLGLIALIMLIPFYMMFVMEPIQPVKSIPSRRHCGLEATWQPTSTTWWRQ